MRLESMADERLQGHMGNWSLSGRDDCTEMFAKQVTASQLVATELEPRAALVS